MSNISYDWIVLGVAAILFAVLSFLKRKKNAGFTTRVLLATVFGIILGIAFKGHTDYVGAVGSIWSNAITAVIVAQTEHQLDTDLYYGRKEYSDDLNDGEQFGQTSTQALTGTGPSQRTNITNDAKFDSANVSQQQSGFTLNFAPNAVLSASGDDACCGTKSNK